MTIQQFIKETYCLEDTSIYSYVKNRPAIICKDRFEMSVQASSGHYCIPRKNVYEYEALEIGFPSEKEELIMEYAEEPDCPTETVYGYVPIDIIQQVIDKHGGIDFIKTFKLYKK